MLKKRVNDSVVRSDKINVCRIIFQLLGGILCGLLSAPVAVGEVPKISATNLGTAAELLQRIQDKSDFKKRRDPFRPIKKRRSISSSARIAHLEPPTITPIPTINNPNWKLLGIIHGQYARQAVIQVSPNERILVRSGLEVVRSGWIIKTISKGEVLLEHSSTSTSGKGLSEPKAFILSFSTLGKSS